MADIPWSDGALIRERRLGHDIGKAERGGHRRAKPIGRFVVEVVGEPQGRCGFGLGAPAGRQPLGRLSSAGREPFLAELSAYGVKAAQMRGEEGFVARAA